MRHNSNICLKNLSYSTPYGQTIFKDLTITFNQNKTAIIGKNGVGKSTLLKLIIGELQPSSGSISILGDFSYCPQNFLLNGDKTIAEIMEVDKKLEALRHIENGDIDEKLFEIIDDDWGVQSRLDRQLNLFDLKQISYDRTLNSMSGGEITRLWLAKVFFEDKDFILLDEPSNNLDLQSKSLLYNAVTRWNKGLIIISHDRNLLELFDQIIEISSIGVKSYGGNYNYYLEQKKLEQDAAMQHFMDAQKKLNNTKQTIQKSREKLEQRKAKGSKMRKLKSQSKLILNSMKERSEKTQNKLNIKKTKLLTEATQQLQQAKEKIEESDQITIKLPNTYVPNKKLILKITDTTFSYKSLKDAIIKSCNLTIIGSERIALLGDNGSGKTTLVKLILGLLTPYNGEIKLYAERVSYLDQNIDILDSNLSILDNYIKLNPDTELHQARYRLSKFLFPEKDILKLVKNLSRGEKLRVGLCCILTSDYPAQMLILDEPTNHLDLESIRILESTLNCYQGALLVISHDEQFINNIGVTKTILLKNGQIYVK